MIGDIQKKAASLQYATIPMPAANLDVEKDFYVTNSAKGNKAAAVWDFVQFMMKAKTINNSYQ